MPGIKLTTKQFVARSRKIHNNFYDYSKTTYLSAKTKLIIVCPTHGSFEQIAHNHMNGKGCPTCGCEAQKSKISKNTTTFIADAKKMHGLRYSYRYTRYYRWNDKVTILCQLHGKFQQVASDHLRGAGCPVCKISKGELKVKTVLESQNLQFIYQYRFKNCRRTLSLPFDFAILDKNQKVIGLIEYQGEQHYKPVYFGTSSTNQEIIQQNDEIKRQYCLKEHIPFLKIPYWDKNNIQNIVLEFITMQCFGK